MTHKHTPGPWFISDSHEDIGNTRIGSAKDYICLLHQMPDDEASAYENERQEKANACLIAAAPELLEVLEHIAEEYNNFPSKTAPAYLKYVNKVINQAKGETS